MSNEARLRRFLIKAGLRGDQLSEAVISGAKRLKYIGLGGKAYDRKMDLHQIKTFVNINPDLVEWIVEGWENRHAFRQGQQCRREFGDLEDNPYKSNGPELNMRQLTLEALWREGFQSA